MSAVAVSPGFTAESFDAFIASRNEPVWLKAMRRAAWNQFREMQLPSRREEEWMRTDIRMFKLEKFAPPSDAAAVAPNLVPSPLLSAGVDLGGAMSVVNGRFQEGRLAEDLARQGVLFGSLDTLCLLYTSRCV